MEGNDAHRETASLLGEKCLPSPLITCEKLVGVWIVGLFANTNLWRFGLLVAMPMGGHHPLQLGQDPTFICSNTSCGCKAYSDCGQK